MIFSQQWPLSHQVQSQKIRKFPEKSGSSIPDFWKFDIRLYSDVDHSREYRLCTFKAINSIFQKIRNIWKNPDLEFRISGNFLSIISKYRGYLQIFVFWVFLKTYSELSNISGATPIYFAKNPPCPYLISHVH